MDLQAAYKMNGKRWSLTKIAAFLCFAVACGLLIGSLTGFPAAKAARAGLAPLSQGADQPKN